MTNRVVRGIEVTANIAIIVVALLIGVVIVNKYLLNNSAPSETAQSDSRIAAGTKINLPNVDWTQSKQTLLLVLSDSCHFCAESAGFYQRLAQEKSKHGNVRMVAVLPQDVNAGQAYLNKLGVAVDDVKQASLGSVGVRGTPTLMLVDGAGLVSDSWVGKLPAPEESKVLSKLY